MIIISGAPCETFNFSVKGSLVLSRIPNLRWGGLSVGIARTTSKARYEIIYVAIKLFRRIGIGGEHSGNFIHLNVDPEKRKTLPGLVEGGGRNSGKHWSL